LTSTEIISALLNIITGPNLERVKEATARQIKEEVSRLSRSSTKARSSSNADDNAAPNKKNSVAKPASEAHPTPKPTEESSGAPVKKSTVDTASSNNSHTTSATKTKSSKRRKKQAEEEIQLRDDEDSPWDQSDDESDEQLSLDQFIPPYVFNSASPSQAPPHSRAQLFCSARPRLIARIPRLVLIEEHCFGTKNIDEYELPGKIHATPK